ncbi:cytochrome P450 [Phenylobacterium montanum]|uniref:Cytochrome P450 n=1 Tax=Phenylobacterium montanum TaxID=2823693 RepID=A0A975G4S1_9CAUL|nr:cytochrome P450 [Caulobacter sp. S6]QUD90522.1 cytochrome P450 [Caulobacter sp. S6]
MPHDDASPRPDIATCPLTQINAFDPEILQDPYPYFARLRAEAPVFRDPMTGIVSVSTYALIMEVNRQPQVFSNDFSAQLRSGSTSEIDADELAILSQGWPVSNTMLTADPPAHTRYRKLAMKAFTYKRVEGMGEYVAQVTNDLIDQFAADGQCEFKSAFANHLPMTVIADALGAPRSDMDLFHRWSDAFVVQLGGISEKPARLEAARRIVEFQRYFVDKIEEKRARPTDDVISDLVHADLSEEGDARKMDYSELLSILQQLLVAGNETTAHSLTAGLYYLISNPDQMARLKADPSLYPGLVEETLRYLTPTNNMWRVATRDAEIGGFPVKAGEMVLVRYGSGNRDAAHFSDADRFDIGREDAKSHLAFGAGIHTCIGAQLARKEMTTAFPILLDRLRNIRFQEGRNSFRYSPNILLRGVLELHIAFDPA